MNSALLFYTFLIIFVILNVLDGHSTYKVVSNTNYKNEKNPVARLLFKLTGPLAGILILKSILIPVIFLMFYVFSFGRSDINIVLGIANIFYLGVVIHNYNVLKRMNYHRIMMEEMSLDDE